MIFLNSIVFYRKSQILCCLIVRLISFLFSSVGKDATKQMSKLSPSIRACLMICFWWGGWMLKQWAVWQLKLFFGSRLLLFYR